MEPIYVTGHRNPDTDSIVSAMAYAALRNALGDRQYIAARLGDVSDETQMVLERFGFEAPVRIHNMRTQVRDLEYDVPPILSRAVTVSHAWRVLEADERVQVLPIANEDGTLYGTLTRGDIAEYDIESIQRPLVEEVPLFNLVGALEGRLVGGKERDSVSGEVVIALPQAGDRELDIEPGSVVICGEQPEVIRRAVEVKASCLILCRTERSGESDIDFGDTVCIATPFDAYRAARVIYQSIPAERICHTSNLVRFHLSDYLDDVREIMLQSRFRAYPILDENDRVVGVISRYHLIRPNRKRVVLVDHNEVAQSVPGLDQTEIMEIIDHHRLADVQTNVPIYMRNEPVGSTATIVAGMYQERGIMPGRKLAGLIAAAILADTVMFKSPTCTNRDREMAERMARLAQISLDQVGHEIFASASSEDKPASDMLFSDFKDFHIAGHTLGIGQITCTDSERVLSRKEEFLSVMEETMKKREYDMMMLMVTDVLKEGTELLYMGDDNTIAQAFNVEPKDHSVFLKGCMSRKKQVVPTLSAMWG